MVAWLPILATAEAGPTFATGGNPWWQTLGGLLVVFGLLILALKFLGKWNRRQGGGQAQVLTVWPLGPKREIQVLRLGDDVHYIYRHDNAMVLLKQEDFASYEADRQAGESLAGPSAGKRFLPKGLNLRWLSPDSGGAAPDLTSR